MAKIKVASKDKAACEEYRKPIEKLRHFTKRTRKEEYRGNRYGRCNRP